MTDPDPHNPPLSRRAARVQRERDAERAHDAARATPLNTPQSTAPVSVAASGTGPATASASTRRAAKTAQLWASSAPRARHARSSRGLGVGSFVGLAVVASLILGSAASVTAAVTAQPLFAEASAVDVSEQADGQGEPGATVIVAEPGAPAEEPVAVPMPAPAQSIPAPTVTAAPAAVELCARPAFTDALSAGDDAAAIAAAGGAEAFRTAVASAAAPCVALDDPARVWAVINKARPVSPLDYEPAPVELPQNVRSLEGGALRSDAAAALSAMAATAAAAGVGEIALESGFRSFTTQQSSYANQVNARGVAQADLASARPGYSEHQTGLAGDVVACSGGCGTLDDLAASAQGAWILAYAWEFGWITRYEAGATPITGYSPEPWHLRYIGPELAKAYHDGGWHTLEEFFGLPAAPAYLQ